MKSTEIDLFCCRWCPSNQGCALQDKNSQCDQQYPILDNQGRLVCVRYLYVFGLSSDLTICIPYLNVQRQFHLRAETPVIMKAFMKVLRVKVENFSLPFALHEGEAPRQSEKKECRERKTASLFSQPPSLPSPNLESQI